MQVKVYPDDLRASVALHKRLSEEWKDLSQKLTPFNPLRETIRDFREKVSLRTSGKQFGVRDFDLFSP